MDVNPINEITKLRKEINRLLSKEMSNIYLKVTNEKNWRTRKFDFSLKIRCLGIKLCVALLLFSF